ncbi:hypothetical protein E2562_024991 [Oryza meyeriana var. granulata]|uniref:Uncharacterized protein n=1 Tax=Oryza meyeriana var. granulata TaxID=110450 RepID=A0A6G1FC48_9ORYZ|nr:hypothetical protein E2562_024991 [Oryza meyeriana var. granulata]
MTSTGSPSSRCRSAGARHTAARSSTSIEQRFVTLGIAGSALRVDPMPGGLDFFFASPTPPTEPPRRIHLLTGGRPRRHRNSYKFKHTFAAGLCLVCREDLVFLPKEVSPRDFGGLSNEETQAMTNSARAAT